MLTYHRRLNERLHKESTSHKIWKQIGHFFVTDTQTAPIIYVSVRLDVQDMSTCPRTFRRMSKHPKIPGRLHVTSKRHSSKYTLSGLIASLQFILRATYDH